MPRQCSATWPQRAEVDLQQHRHDHQPDQHRHRQVDLGHVIAAERLERRRQQLAEDDAGDDAERDPERQIALEGAERRRGAAAPVCRQRMS